MTTDATSVNYFVDTNFFLECSKPHELKWEEIGEKSDQVILVVAPAVVNELEKHKSNSNDRKSRRAKEASAHLRKALQNSDHAHVLKESGPRILLQLPPVQRIDYANYPSLDPNKPDHQIAAELDVYRNTLGCDARLLSDDTLCVLAARNIGVPVVMVPETWKLQDQPDARDKEIKALKDELSAYRNARPLLAVRLLDHDGNPADTLTIRVTRFEPTAEEIEALVEEAAAVHPLETEFKKRPGRVTIPDFGNVWKAPTDEEISRYQEESYPAWLTILRDRLQHLPVILEEQSRSLEFHLEISNIGLANAESVSLTLTAFDGLLLGSSFDDEEQTERRRKRSLPAPPVPPAGKFVQPFSGMGLYGQSYKPFTPIDMRRHEHDPTAFYWKPAYPAQPRERLKLTCDALPHQVDATFHGYRVVVPREPITNGGRIHVQLHASNILRPIDLHARVQVIYEQGDFLAAVRPLVFADPKDEEVA